ncbi:MAG: threonine synthase [Burkholderiaceae bacterium]
MKYLSTRGGPLGADGFTDVLLGGLAPDGGLVMPAQIARLTPAELERWRPLAYPDLAFEVLSRFATDIPEPALRALVRASYTEQVFGSADITPLTMLDDSLGLLHLSNGPTLAFKDVAMQLLGHLFEWVLAQRGQQLNILGATSGDTGSAAEYAMRARQGVRVFMLSPDGRMSAFQRAQMYSLMDENIHNISVRGVFDDCQDMVKAVSADAAFKRRHAIGAVNSINGARIVAQVVYYFKGYFAATTDNAQQVSFAVPSGNFGNVLAGHIARMMGLPIARLVVATNENNVLDEFIRTGLYRVRRASETHATSSPSMDISKASNFERFVYDLVGRDTKRVASLWQELATRGEFDLSGEAAFGRVALFGMVSGSSTHQMRLDTIRDIHRRHGLLVDPHTADGLTVASRYRDPGVPMICLETAQPAKFADTIHEALGIVPPMPAGLAHLAEATQRYTLMPASVPMLKSLIASVCSATAAG